MAAGREHARWVLSEADADQDGLVDPDTLAPLLQELSRESGMADLEALAKAAPRIWRHGLVDLEALIDSVFPEVEGAKGAGAEVGVHASEEPSDSTAEGEAAQELGQGHHPAAEALADGGAHAPPLAGQLFTWGRGSDGQLGQDDVCYPKPNCALPHPVRELRSVVQVACGGGQQGCTAAVTSDGKLYTFGNNFRGRLGHGEGPCVRKPRLVELLAGERVLAAACGSDHTAAVVAASGGGSGVARAFLWGGNGHGQLGRGHAQKSPDCMLPAEVHLPGSVRQVDCEDQYSAAVLEDGGLWMWGCNGFGRLGLGGGGDRHEPAMVQLPAVAASVSLGSLYAGAVAAGELFLWGYGGHGNLGLGNRKSSDRPQQVTMPEPVAQLACTRGQEGCKGGLNPTGGGQEGPHTVVVAQSGALYTMGTCHKGLLCNLGSKDGAFGKPWDELLPYKVGGHIRNTCKDPPLSPHAAWPPPYDSIGPQVQAVSGHIHAACVGRDGRAWAWGCGSNDGRCGVERFLNMKGEGRPPEVDLMKCYMMGPHRIGIARPLYWKYPSLSGHRVLQLATGRNHMAAIAVRGPQENG